MFLYCVQGILCGVLVSRGLHHFFCRMALCHPGCGLRSHDTFCYSCVSIMVSDPALSTAIPSQRILKKVPASLPDIFSKPVESDGFKIRVVKLFPDAEKLNSVAVPDPAADKIVRAVRILITCDIRDADIIFIILYEYCNFLFKDIEISHNFPPVFPPGTSTSELLYAAISVQVSLKGTGVGCETIGKPGL